MSFLRTPDPAGAGAFCRSALKAGVPVRADETLVMDEQETSAGSRSAPGLLLRSCRRQHCVRVRETVRWSGRAIAPAVTRDWYFRTAGRPTGNADGDVPGAGVAQRAG
jgi:hypothetical protein